MSIMSKVTVAEYDQMIAEGYFEEPGRRRMELLFGEIQAMSPIGPDHEYLVDRLARWSFENTGGKGVHIRIQNSVGLPDLDSVPQPDILWVRDREYFSGRPTIEDVLLVIEVAASSLAKDRGPKALLYAVAGIPDYWIVNVEDPCVEVFRDPQADGYRAVGIHGVTEVVHPLLLPDVSLSIGELFRRAEKKRISRLSTK